MRQARGVRQEGGLSSCVGKQRLVGRGRRSAWLGDRAPVCCWTIMTAAAGSQTVAVATGHGGCSGLAGRRRRAFGPTALAVAAAWTHFAGASGFGSTWSLSCRKGRAPRARAQGGARRQRTVRLLLLEPGWARAGGPVQLEEGRPSARRLQSGQSRCHESFDSSRCCRICVAATDNLCNQPGVASAASRQQAEMQRARAARCHGHIPHCRYADSVLTTVRQVTCSNTARLAAALFG